MITQPKSTDAVIVRAERALRCAPFSLKLFVDLSTQGISLKTIATANSDNPYLIRTENFITVENSLLWLSQVGVLRREVDGQGITDSFRLTPLGYEIIGKYQPLGSFPNATFGDRLQNFLAQLQPSRFF